MEFFSNFKKSAKEFSNLRSLVAMAMLLALRVVLAAYVSVRISDSLKISTGFIASAVIGVMFGPVPGFVLGAIGDVLQWMLNPTGPIIIGLTLNAGLIGMVYGIAFYGKTPQASTSEIKNDGLKSLRIAAAVISAVAASVGFIMLLLAYSDRKTKTYAQVYYIVAGLLIATALILILILLLNSSVDRVYILKIVVAAIIINVGINAFLGTYFLAVTYGWVYNVYFIPRLIKNLLQLPVDCIVIYYLLLALGSNSQLRRIITKAN